MTETLCNYSTYFPQALCQIDVQAAPIYQLILLNINQSIYNYERDWFSLRFFSKSSAISQHPGAKFSDVFLVSLQSAPLVSYFEPPAYSFALLLWKPSVVIFNIQSQVTDNVLLCPIQVSSAFTLFSVRS
jgi:hypothetical protein